MGNDFEKHIRDAMNNPPEFPFEERLWEDMESRLDGDQEKPFLGFIGRLPLFLLALGAMSFAGFFYVKHHNANERLIKLEKQLENQTAQEQEASIEKRVTVIYDTIYNRVVINDPKNLSAFENTLTSSKKQQSYTATYLFAPGYSPSTIDFRKSMDLTTVASVGITNDFSPKNNIGFLRKDILSRTEYIKSLPNFDSALAVLSTPEQTYLEVDQEVKLPSIKFYKLKKQKRINILLKEIRPTNFSLIGTTGTFASLNLGGNGFNLRGTFHGELNFGKRFSLLAGGEYFSNDFGLKIGMDEEGIPEGFPEILPNSSEDELLSIQGDFNYFQIPFGVKYIVFPRRYFYPYIGGGLVAGKTTRSRLEYNYISTAQGFEYSVSKGGLLPKTFEMSAFYSTIGFQVQLNRNWSILMEGSSQFDLKKGKYKYENLSILKLSSGIRYRF